MEPVPAEDPGLWNRPLGVLALATAAVCYILPCLIWKNLANYAKLHESKCRLDELFDQYRSKAIATGIGLLL